MGSETFEARARPGAGGTLRITWWGTRGGIATPEPDVMRYGGDTSCVEVRTSDGELFILDAGTGLRQLGQKLIRDSSWIPRAHIFLSHFHWDHIQGLPFFAPMFRPGCEVTIYGSFKADQGLLAILQGQMGSLYFPVSLDDVTATIRVREMLEETIHLGAAKVTSSHLNHPQGCFGYRIQDGGAIFVYATDVEQSLETPTDPRLLSLARDADVLAFDAQYTPEEYKRHVGWGHSTWRVATRLAREAGVGKLVLIHHDPYHPDDFMDRLLVAAQREFPETVAAYRGLTLPISTGRRRGPSLLDSTELPAIVPSRAIPLVERRDDVLLVVLPDVVNARNCRTVNEVIRAAMQAGPVRRLVFDLQEVGRMDSSGLGVLVELRRYGEGLGAEVVGARAKEVVLDLFRITGVERLIPVHATVEEAMGDVLD